MVIWCVCLDTDFYSEFGWYMFELLGFAVLFWVSLFVIFLFLVIWCFVLEQFVWVLRSCGFVIAYWWWRLVFPWGCLICCVWFGVGC